MSSTDPFDDGLFDDDDDVEEQAAPAAPSKGTDFSLVEKLHALFDPPLGLMPVTVDKIPLLKQWTTREVVKVHDLDYLRARFAEQKQPTNIGLVLGNDCGPHGAVVVEADNDAGERWIEENLPSTPVRTVARRGRHRVFAHPLDGRVRNSNDALGSKVRWEDDLEEAGYDIRGKRAKEEAKDAGLKKSAFAELVATRQKEERERALKDKGECPYPLIDVKADGGYTVAPGSTHKSGHVYAGEGWDEESWDSRPVWDRDWLPERYRSRFRGQAKLAKDLEHLREVARKTPDGGLVVDYDSDECTPARKLQRAMRYQEECDPAIEGSGGHNDTFFVACRTFVGFDLDYAQALDVMRAYSERCQPPWDDLELEHKLQEADACASEPRGCMLFNRESYEENKKRRSGQAGALRRVEKVVEELVLDEDEDEDGEPAAPAREHLDDGQPLSEDDKLKSKHWAKYGVDWMELKHSGFEHYVRSTDRGVFIPNEQVNIAAILSIGSKFAGRLAYNELKMRPTLDGKPLKDRDIIRIKAQIDYIFRKSSPKGTVEDAVVDVSHRHSFDPVVDYLQSLSWDGTERLDKLATEVLRVTRYPELATAQVRKWALSAVARALVPGCQVDTALIINGEQGAGKSSFFRIMFLDDRDEGFFTSSDVDLANKDSLLNIGTTWGWEWSELQHVTNPKRVNLVKSFLSETSDKFRPPYGKHMEERPRRVSIVGTTNDQALIFDPTGSRRFWIVKVPDPDKGGINLALAREWRDQIWAEAVHWVTRFLEDEDERGRWWLTAAEDLEREEAAKDYEPRDVWFDDVADIVDRITMELFSVPDVLKKLGVDIERRDFISEKRVTQILRQLGCAEERPRINGRRVRRWRKPPVE